MAILKTIPGLEEVENTKEYYETKIMNEVEQWENGLKQDNYFISLGLLSWLEKQLEVYGKLCFLWSCLMQWLQGAVC